MATGVDGVSAIESSAVSFSVFQWCFKALTLLLYARACDRHSAGLDMRLELEQARLFFWVKEPGLLSRPPVLRVQHPFQRCVRDVLKQIEMTASRFAYIEAH